jgi:hypothetical protein
MPIFRFFFVALLCIGLWGCVENDTVVHVKPDGSGIIEETVMMSDSIMESMQAFSQGLGGMAAGNDKAKPGDNDPVKEMIKQAPSRAGRFGPDVKFVSVAPAKREEMSGYKAIYEFKDINKLMVSQNPEDKMGKTGDEKSEKKEEMIRFTLVRGPQSTLTVTMPQERKSGKAEADPKDAEAQKRKMDPEAMKQANALFKGMRIRVALKIDGNILETNATYRDKTQLTLLDMQFSKILENKAAFEKFSAVQPKSVEEMKELVKNIEGLKVEMNNPVVVKFK